MQPAEIAAAAIHAGQAVKVQSASGGSVSSWITAAVAVLGSLGVYLGVWPKLKALSNARLDSLDNERRGDMIAMRERLTAVELEAKTAVKEAREAQHMATERAHVLETQLAATVTAIGMLTRRIKREWPDDAILEEVSSMMELALSKDGGFRDGISKIIAASIKS